MKKTKEIIGLPIISIADAVEKGKVKGVIVNADRGAVDYIIVDSGFQVIGMRVVSTENVLGIGEYALTIEDEKSIIDISSVPKAIELLQNDVQVTKTRVMTKKGRLIGETGDYFVDEELACSIAGLEFVSEITEGKIRLVPRKSVITFGKSLIVVTDDIEDVLIDSISDLSSDGFTSGLEKKNLVESKPVFEEPEIQKAEPIIEELVEEPETIEVEPENEEPEEVFEVEPEVETELLEDLIETEIEPEEQEVVVSEDNVETVEMSVEPETKEAEAKPAAESSAAGLFEQRQRQYLKGRYATKAITDNSGNILVNEGILITDEIIDTVKASGKMIELVMNNKA